MAHWTLLRRTGTILLMKTFEDIVIITVKILFAVFIETTPRKTHRSSVWSRGPWFSVFSIWALIKTNLKKRRNLKSATQFFFYGVWSIYCHGGQLKRGNILPFVSEINQHEWTLVAVSASTHARFRRVNRQELTGCPGIPSFPGRPGSPVEP